MKKCCWWFARLIAVCAILSGTGAKADWAYDTMVFTNNYDSAGCSGTYTGMNCRKRAGARQESPFEKNLREKLARERDATEATTKDALAAIEDLFTRPDELLEPFGLLPHSAKFMENQSTNVVCLRAHLGALFLLQEHPELFARLAAEKQGGVEGLEIYTYGFWYSRIHSLSMYHHASRLVGGSKDLMDQRFASKMQELILSQLGPALAQMGYFSSRYDLWYGSRSPIPNHDVTETVLSVGFRIGFFSEKLDKVKYPFTDRYCGVERPQLPNVEKIREVVTGLEPEFLNFRLESVLPTAMRAAIMRSPTVGSYDWLMSNEHKMGTRVDWLGARVLAIGDIEGSVPGFERYKNGVMIVHVEDKSLAKRVGIENGHIIFNIRPIPPKYLTQRNGIVVNSADDMIKATKQEYPVHGFNIFARRPRTPGSLSVDARF